MVQLDMSTTKQSKTLSVSNFWLCVTPIHNVSKQHCNLRRRQPLLAMQVKCWILAFLTLSLFPLHRIATINGPKNHCYEAFMLSLKSQWRSPLINAMN